VVANSRLYTRDQLDCDPHYRGRFDSRGYVFAMETMMRLFAPRTTMRVFPTIYWRAGVISEFLSGRAR
jgi:hypothetical protein